MSEKKTEILVAGASLGGVAAAYSALRLGKKVIMSEATDWPGGQLTAQLVPPDEHPWIEQVGSSVSWRELRRRVREYYRTHYPLRATPRAEHLLNPGLGAVGKICAEPRVFLSVIYDLFAPYLANGQLELMLRHVPIQAELVGDRVCAITFENNTNSKRITVSAELIIDATDFGDILELAKIEHVIGAESRAETDEMHALSGPADPMSQQAITWCAAIDFRQGENHVGEKPANYEYWRDYEPTPWEGPQFGWNFYHPVNKRTESMPLFAGPMSTRRAADWWHYRRLLYTENFEPGYLDSDVTVINWPQNDYWHKPLLGVSIDAQQNALAAAREVTQALLYWLQTEAPNDTGESGYPGLRLRPSISDTDDGFAKAPYVRESRRIRALQTLREGDIGVEQRDHCGYAESVDNSIGVGYYRIDLHSTPSELMYVDVPCYPFQLPLGCLIPERVENVLPGSKNLGVTHITNGTTRMHPTEWVIGEAAGALAAFSLSSGDSAQTIFASRDKTSEFRELLHQRIGIDLEWPKYGSHDKLLIDW